MRENSSLVELGRRLIEEGRDLVRQEVELAKVEIIALIKTNVIAAGLFVGAAVLALVTLIMLQVAILLTLPFDIQYIVAWCLFGFWLLLLLVLVIVGRAKLRFKLPEKTIATLKGDMEWAKGQIRSNGRS